MRDAQYIRAVNQYILDNIGGFLLLRNEDMFSVDDLRCQKSALSLGKSKYKNIDDLFDDGELYYKIVGQLCEKIAAYDSVNKFNICSFALNKNYEDILKEVMQEHLCKIKFDGSILSVRRKISNLSKIQIEWDIPKAVGILDTPNGVYDALFDMDCYKKFTKQYFK